jgi:acetyl esterase/lipase
VPCACDPEVASVLDALEELAGPMPDVPPGDWARLRQVTNDSLAWMAKQAGRSSPDVRFTELETTAADGAALALRWYERRGSAPGSAVVYAHGGGMVAGSLDLCHPVVADYVLVTGVPFLAAEYRLAPEVDGTRPAEDVFAALGWLLEHARELGVDPARVAVMGDSAGGGLAAAASILAREAGIALAHQILVYPMLDDRPVAGDGRPERHVTWTRQWNDTAWTTLLGEARGGPDVPAVAAPARLEDFGGLPPAYVEVGGLDIFLDEDITFARGLARAGVAVELHVHPSAPHSFERFAPESALARRVGADRARVIASL